jgi:hypothetical protein
LTRPSLKEDAAPEAFALAMTMCLSYAPACSDAKDCAFDGLCFSRDGIGWAGARRKIQKLIDEQCDVTTRSWLRLAVDALDHHQFLARGAIDALKVVAINRRVREEYGAPAFRGGE